MKDKNQNSGDGSTNYQAETINVVGVTVSDVRAIAKDLMKAELAGYQQHAAELAMHRVEELADRVLSEIQKKESDLLLHFRDPAIQMVLKNAEKTYVRSGKPAQLEILSQALCSRLEHMENDAVAVVLDEAIDVVAKLTEPQLNALTVCFVMRNTRALDLANLDSMKLYLSNINENLIVKSSKTESTFHHLAYAGCVGISIGGHKFSEVMQQSYPGLFNLGFEFDSLDEELKPLLSKSAFIPCIHNKERLQVSADHPDAINRLAALHGWSVTQKEKLHAILVSNVMPIEKIQALILSWNPQNQSLFDFWDDSLAYLCDPTSVGRALGIANATRQIGRQYDIRTWIN